VPRGYLAVLCRDDAVTFSTGSGRLELARAIASCDNPLTARVIVNRIWKHHFGKGLVPTTSNFGRLGELPTHPELLDHLATRLMQSGWSLKTLHREIMLSATYMQSSGSTPEAIAADPENRLYARMNRRCLEVEAWRDAMLEVAGQLDRTVGGPSIDLGETTNKRRTVYGAVSRHNLNPLLRLFDFPDPNITSDSRPATTVPLQQLFVLNSDFMVRIAQALAGRIQAVSSDDVGRIQYAFSLVYGRAATDQELQLGLEFVRANVPSPESEQDKLTKWEQYAQVLLSANEFMYVD
jgi:hypothetical protein